MAVARSLATALLLRLALLAVVGARQGPLKLAQPDYTLYHTKDGVFQAVREIVKSCPETMRIDEDTLADGEYSSTLSIVTVEPAGLSPAGSNYAGKIRLLLNFGEHGRELISSEIGLNVLRLLCDEAARAPLLAKYKLDPAAVRAVLQRAVFKVVPMENVRGRERVEAGELCERKNGRGVDPNRNWGVHWGFKEKDYDPSEEFPGSAPFSEPEAALMLRAARALRPHVWASVHSGMDAIFMPYDHKAEVPEGPGPAATLAILQQLNERTCRKKCATGSGGKSVGYLAHGTATDYMFQELHVPVPMTWEVYGDQKAHFEDCFRMFNPLTRQAYDATVESWTGAVFVLLSLLPQHPEVAAELGPPAREGQGSIAGAAAGAGSEGGAGSATEGSSSAAKAATGGAMEPRQQQDSSAGAGAGQAVGAGDTSSSGSGNAANDSADKAVEIASALKEHLQQGAEGEQDAAAAAAAGAAQRMLGMRRGAAPRRQRRWVLQLLYWMAVAALGCCAASFLWRKPRFRYLLSKHLGASRRRGRAGLIPV